MSNFIANGLSIGGVYPFKTKQRNNKENTTVEKNSIPFQFVKYGVESDIYDIIGNKKLVFGENQTLCKPIEAYRLNTLINVKLNNGIVYENLKFTCIISKYKEGFSSLLFWIDLSTNKIPYSTIIELISIVRQTSGNEDSASIIIINSQKISSEFKDINKLIKEIQRGFLSMFEECWEELDSNNYIYPITYIYEVEDCKNSKQIINKYGKEIAGICDTWKHYYNYFKESEVQRIVDSDLHPFDYGVSVYTSSGMVELHSENFNELKKITKYTSSEQHIYEQIFLYIICEVSILNLYVLKWYDEQLTKIGLKSFKLRWNIIGFFIQLKNITNLHNSTIDTLSIFNETPNLSKSYIPLTIDKLNTIFGIDKYTTSIRDKLNDIKQQLTIAYTMTTTVSIIILTIVGIVFTVFQMLLSI